VLIDEIDGINSKDRGGLSELLKELEDKFALTEKLS
jgi:hypothetical protein